jgi:hypothetical protein
MGKEKIMLFRIFKRRGTVGTTFDQIGIAPGQSRKQAIEKLAGNIKPAFPQKPLNGYWENARGELFCASQVRDV